MRSVRDGRQGLKVFVMIVIRQLAACMLHVLGRHVGSIAEPVVVVGSNWTLGIVAVACITAALYAGPGYEGSLLLHILSLKITGDCLFHVCFLYSLSSGDLRLASLFSFHWLRGPSRGFELGTWNT